MRKDGAAGRRTDRWPSLTHSPVSAGEQERNKLDCWICRRNYWMMMISLIKIVKILIMDLWMWNQLTKEQPTLQYKRRFWTSQNASNFCLVILVKIWELMNTWLACACWTTYPPGDCPSTLGISGSAVSKVQIRGRDLVNPTRNLGRNNESAASTQLLSIGPDLLVYLMIGENSLHTNSR